MLVWKMALRGIKSRRSTSFMLFLFIVLVTLFAITSVNLLLSGERIWASEYEKQDCPDYCAYFAGDSVNPDYVDFFRNHPNVLSVRQRPIILIGADQNNWTRQKGFSILFFADSAIKPGEISAPYYQIVQGGAMTGDIVEISINGYKKTLTITGAYDDPMTGGTMLGTHLLPISPQDFDEISNYGSGNAIELSAKVKPGTNLVDLNNSFGHSTESVFTLTKPEIHGYILVVPNMISYFLMAVAILLVLAALIALRHSIIAQLEFDYKTIGVLKSFGTDNRQILSFVLLQYLSITAIGTVAGSALSIAIEKPVLYIFLSFAGLAPQMMVFPLLITGTVAALCGIALLTAWISARRVYAVSPVRAISLGQNPIHFSHRSNISLQKMSFVPKSAKFAVKHTVSKPGHLTAVLTISVIFSYILITLLGFYNAMSDERESAKLFGQPVGDICVYINPDINGVKTYEMNDILDDINHLSKIDETYDLLHEYAEIDGTRVVVEGYSDYGLADFSAPISGRYPKYANEVMITPQIQDIFHANLGDRLEIKEGDVTKAYLVVGIVSAADDMGKCVFRALDASDARSLSSRAIGKAIVLKDSDDLQNTIDTISGQYGDAVYLVNMRDAVKSVTEGIQLGVLGITAVVIVVAVALILLTTALVARIAVIREQIDMGVLHAAGYSKKTASRAVCAEIYAGIICWLHSGPGSGVGLFGQNDEHNP